MSTIETDANQMSFSLSHFDGQNSSSRLTNSTSGVNVVGGKPQLAVSLSTTTTTTTTTGGGLGPRKNSYHPSVQHLISEQQQQNDLLSIPLTRIFFHNSKNNRIGKHNVSLVLVESLYAIKGLDYLVSSKITRSNSIGTTGSSSSSSTYMFQHRNSSSNPVNNSQILNYPNLI